MADKALGFLIITVAYTLPVNGLMLTFSSASEDKAGRREFLMGVALLSAALLCQKLFLYRIYPYDSLIMILAIVLILTFAYRLPVVKSLLFTLIILCILELVELAASITAQELFNIIPGAEAQYRGADTFAMKIFYLIYGGYLYVVLFGWRLLRRLTPKFSGRRGALLRILLISLVMVAYYMLYVVILTRINFNLGETDSMPADIQVFLYVSFTISAVFLCFYIYSNIRLYKAAGENRTLQQQMQATQVLIEELRRFKHNYLNIIYGFGSHIAETGSPELLAYYEQTVQESRKIGGDNIISVQKIRNTAVHNLLMSHMALLSGETLPFFLNVEGELRRTKIRDVDLCQVLGIFLDNAREAAAGVKDSMVKLDILAGGELVEFYVYNTFTRNKTSNALKETGDDRGHGLEYADAILRQYKNVIHNTYEKNGQYVQQLLVKERRGII